MTVEINKDWAIVDGDNIVHQAETKLEVLEYAWSHDIDPHHYELIALPENGGVGPI